MASFSFKTFGQVLQLAIDTIKANSATLIDFGEGSIVRVILEAVALVGDYFTVQLRKILLITRAATSSGADLDSFVADYNMTPRLSAVYAQGTVTLSRRAVTSSTVFIAVGATIISNDDLVTFEVIADPTNPAYNASANGYYIASNQASVDVTVKSQAAGVAGNVLANTLTVIGSNLAGVDSANNALAITNGVDEETDAALRKRFVKYIDSLSRGTKAALEYAVSIVQNGLIYIVKENVDITGAEKKGTVIVVVDDGSGTPSASLLDAIRESLDKYRAFGISVVVYAPTLLSTNVACTVTVESGYVAATVKAAVQTAITTYLNSMKFEQFLAVNRIADIAFNVPGVKDVESMTLNGGSADIQPDFNEIIKAGTITVS